MSMLTKVFIVLLVVFSIAFTTMSVSLVAQMTDWRETAEKYEEHARVADANLRHLIAANAAEIAAANDANRGRLGEIADLEEEKQAARNEVDRLQAELAGAASEKSSSDAMSRGLLAQLDGCSASRDEYRAQRDALEKRSIDLERRNIDLNDRVNEQIAQIAVLVEQKRQFEQQVNILKKENERLARAAGRPSAAVALEDPSGAAMPQVTALTPTAAVAIRGHVVDVSGSIVTLSVGAVDGVREDMIFVVHREGQYLGDLKVDLVDPNRSAGRAVGPRFVPRPGDEVTDSASLSASRG